MRRVRVLFLLLPALLTLASRVACGGQSRAGDCGTKVPTEAQRVFDDLVSAFRAANAKGIVGLMEKGNDARLVLSLHDVPRNAYQSPHALGVLEGYFKKHTVQSLTETKDCPKSEGASFTRSFLLTTKTETAETSELLTVRVRRIDVDKKPSIWVLESLVATLIPRK